MYIECSFSKKLIVLSDVLAAMLSFYLLSLCFSYTFLQQPIVFISVPIFTLAVGVFSGNYSLADRVSLWQGLGLSLLFAIRLVVLLILTLFFYGYLGETGLADVQLVFWVCLLSLSFLLVSLLRVVIGFYSKRLVKVPKPIILVTNFSAKSCLDLVLSHGYQVVAYLSQKDHSDQTIPILRDFEEVTSFLQQNSVQEIIVDFDALQEFVAEQTYLNAMGLPITVCLADGLSPKLFVQKMGERQFVTYATNVAHYRSSVIKRMMDIIGALVGLTIMGIVAFIIYPIVQRQSKGPLFFKQERVGLHGKIFQMYKFRSMYLDAEERKADLLKKNDLDTHLMFKMENDPRIFPFGQKIRDWSLDELPQFINVLKGEMSLVGTRPPTVSEYQKYELHHFKRLMTKPGITGMWQVSGRSNITNFEQVVELDMAYIQQWSIWLDIKILLKTLKVVVKREGSK